jgi:mRNA-degrading endonuclease RelE of RelBE toxin-antitoxin system
MRYTFIETSLFSRVLPDYWSDEEYREFQAHLAARPDAGDVIQGAGGLRKIRWAGSGRGKRGGVRVIYYCWDERGRIYLLTLYAKNEASDLTAEQRRKLAALVEEWKREQAESV